MIRSKLPKGDGTQLMGGAAAVITGAGRRSTYRAGVCGQPCHLPGQGLCWGMGTLPWLGVWGSKVTQLFQEGCVESQGHGKGRDHRVLPASAGS